VRASAALPIVLAALHGIAACGGGSGGGGGGDANKPTTLKIGVIPIADVAPLYVGMKDGFSRTRT
jgi:NitT/TauT family transport system substrate-binding protein